MPDRRLLNPLCICVLTLFAVLPFTNATDWPQWRGPNRDCISADKGLLKTWPEEGPPVVWQVDSVGAGYSSLAVAGGRIYTQGDLNGVEHVICLNEKDGQVLWSVQPEPVSEALRKRITEEMKRLDTDGDGVVEELEALARLGWKFNRYDSAVGQGQAAGQDAESSAIAARRAGHLMAELDKNGDGQLSSDEAFKLLRDDFTKIDRSDRDVDAEALAAKRTTPLLEQLDKDGDGRVSRQESRGSVLDRPFGRADKKEADTKKGDQQLTREEIATYLELFEGGKDGRITEQELAEYYLKTKALGDGILTATELRGLYGGYRNGMGDGPRGTPTVLGNRLYVEGGNGDVSCLDAATGKTLWHVNLRSDFGGGVPGWGYSESPLIESDLVVVTSGGKDGTVVALNKENGEVVWRSTDVTQRAHYASPVAASIGGIRQIVQFGRESVFGLDAKTGRKLWDYAKPANGTANCATPLVYQDHVFASSGYGTGGGLAKITTEGATQKAEEVYFDKRMANHHGGIVRIGDYMYGFGNGGLICMHFLTGEVAWRDRSVGKGSLCAADGMLYLLGERHEVALAEATPDGYREHGRFKIASHGRPSWAHPIVANGRFYIRDQGSLTTYDVRDLSRAAR